jgi:hypothetical protein
MKDNDSSQIKIQPPGNLLGWMEYTFSLSGTGR